jgi:hypothetical protein
MQGRVEELTNAGVPEAQARSRAVDEARQNFGIDPTTARGKLPKPTKKKEVAPKSPVSVKNARVIRDPDTMRKKPFYQAAISDLKKYERAVGRIPDEATALNIIHQEVMHEEGFSAQEAWAALGRADKQFSLALADYFGQAPAAKKAPAKKKKGKR